MFLALATTFISLFHGERVLRAQKIRYLVQTSSLFEYASRIILYVHDVGAPRIWILDLGDIIITHMLMIYRGLFFVEK